MSYFRRKGGRKAREDSRGDFSEELKQIESDLWSEHDAFHGIDSDSGEDSAGLSGLVEQTREALYEEFLGPDYEPVEEETSEVRCLSCAGVLGTTVGCLPCDEEAALQSLDSVTEVTAESAPTKSDRGGKECPVCGDPMKAKPNDSWKCGTCKYREGPWFAGTKGVGDKDWAKRSPEEKKALDKVSSGIKYDKDFGSRVKLKSGWWKGWQTDLFKGSSDSDYKKPYTPPVKWISSGGVVLHGLDEKSINYVYIRKPSNNYGGGSWSFPKGRVDGNMSLEATALREVREEIGLKARILADGYLGKGDGSMSITHYYLMVRIGGSTIQHDSESDEVRVVSIEEAIEMFKKVGNKRDREILERAIPKIEALKKKFGAKVIPD